MPGKIMVSGEVFLDGVQPDDAIIFIHIKGHGRARVTHIDIESMTFKKILLPRHSDYPEINWNSEKVNIPVTLTRHIFREQLRFKFQDFGKFPDFLWYLCHYNFITNVSKVYL